MPGTTFNIGYDPILANPFSPSQNYSQELENRMLYLQEIKNRMENRSNNTPTLWNTIDSEINSMNDEQKSILFSDQRYIEIDTQLKQLVQQFLIDSIKGKVEQSEIGKSLLQKQLDYIRSNKQAIISESNKKLEIFEKFKIAAASNPNITYKEFCESIKK